MKTAPTIVAIGLLAGLCYAPAWADEYALTGTIRAFSAAHPDFENDHDGQFPLIQGVVRQDLGPDDKPVLVLGVSNTDDPESLPNSEAWIRAWFRTDRVYVISDKTLSNIVLQLLTPDEEEIHYRYEDLSTTTANLGVPVEDNDGNPIPDGTIIVGSWVKSGSSQSDDGPGYGDYLYLPADGQDDPAASVYIYIPPEWRVESENTFNEWFRHTAGVNEAVFQVVRMNNGMDRPGGIYRFERSMSQAATFFPVSGLMGAEPDEQNQHFTYEVATQFDYTNPAHRDYDMRLSFASADDMWVFINRRLVVDLGGAHEETHGTVNLDSMAAQLGLEPGKRYPFHVFFAQRHTETGSNIVLETNFPIVGPPYD